MALRGRVGRHTKLQGRNCQNWIDDQQQVIAYLNLIPVNEGGAGGSLGGRVINGVASDTLYAAILRFEEKHFPGQRSGFVDPNGRMWNRLVAIAERTPPVAVPQPAVTPQSGAESPLDILRRDVLDESKVRGVWTAGERVAFDPLVTMAVKHIDSLKGQGFNTLPWPVELFGRAYTPMDQKMPIIYDDRELRFWSDPSGKKTSTAEKAPPLPEMRYGAPVPIRAYIITAKLGALLLYAEGQCVRVRPYHEGPIDLMRQVGTFVSSYPSPIFGSDRLGIR